MAITVTERNTSRRQRAGQNGFAERRYIALTTASEAEDAVLAAVLSAAPSSITVDGEELLYAYSDVEPLGPSSWDALVFYGQAGGGSIAQPVPVGENVFSFSTLGGSQRITQSNGTTSYAAAGTAPDFKGAINVTSNGVQGIDINVPVYAFTERHAFASVDVDATFRGNIFRATGTVNNGTFRGFAAGEVRFDGAQGTSRPDGVYEIEYVFAASPNVSGLAVGDITGIAKGGWQFLWVLYEDSVSEDRSVQVPSAVYVEDVYPVSNFSTLGIGV